MSYRLAINGYGRIGRCVLRALYESKLYPELQVVAINELADVQTMAHLTKYDSTHGRFPGPVGYSDSNLLIDGRAIALFAQKNPAKLPWQSLAIDVLLECSGGDTSRALTDAHLQSGAKRVLFSQPAQLEDVDATVVFGVNESELRPEDRVVSAASCTTNGVVPVIQILQRAFGIEAGTITTIHSAMNDQPVIDAYHHTDLRKTRAAGQSIIPVDTELAKGIERILPEMAGKFTAQAVRVPTVNVSAIDLTVVVQQDVSAQSINEALQAALQQRFAHILGYTEEPLASCDFNHDPRSAIVDASQTRVSNRRLVKVLIWFDNEWAYANRMLDVADYLCRL